MKTIIIKSPSGNLQSIFSALRRIGVNAKLTDNFEEILSSDRIIFPGVGEAKLTMRYLREKSLDLLIKKLKQPFLGICLGLQLLCFSSEENNTDCLGIFDLEIKKFKNINKSNMKIPKIGWNNIYQLEGLLFKGIPDESSQYFVHSYFAPICEYTVAKTDYIYTYSSALQKNNFYAVQFHPEKSGIFGQKILENFIQLSI
jgi:imidazole glycerol-phosphate synthase subunit HisH